MKINPTLHPRTPGGSRHRQEKGVALVTVLAIVLLMTVLIMSFFTMSRTELASSIKDSENLKARAFADAAVNMVIGQIREGTTFEGASQVLQPWSSQPGAIRSFDLYGNLVRIFKLYSSDQMEDGSTAQAVNRDVERNWNEKPDQWVDLNEPVVIPNATDPENLNQAELYFPIVDPRAMSSDRKDSVEGFSYERNTVQGTVAPSGQSYTQRLPMPVRWIYFLADGTLGTVSDSGEFQGAGDAQATRENPIVGRVGFWTDDETSKINVNTASEGVYWDTPRASTEEERYLGRNQPVNGEFQRYPGHPAMVCMSSVLFPNKRFYAQASEPPGTTGGESIQMDRMDEEEIQSIWRMSPYIFGEKDNSASKASSFGGTQAPANLAQATPSNPTQIKTLPGAPTPKHLYNSYDDYVIAATADADMDDPRKVKVQERTAVADDQRIKLPVNRIQQGRFFLTTRSSAPEITMRGTPRVALWPIDHTMRTNELAQSSRAAITSGSRYSVFDVLIGFNASLKRGTTVYPYFYQREHWDYRHGEFHNTAQGRNVILYRYIANSLLERIPGFTLRSRDNSGMNFQNFSQKYGPGEGDDCYSLAGMALDYIRNQNTTDGNIMPANRYIPTSSFGQVTPICLCGGADRHAQTWVDSTLARPKGIGRLMTVSEVALHVGLREKWTADATTVPAAIRFHPDNLRTINAEVASGAATGTTYYEYEAAIHVEGFVPSQGWSEYRPVISMTMAGFDGASKLSETRDMPNSAAGNNRTIGPITINGQNMVFINGATGGSFAQTEARPPGDWIGWGGGLGIRYLQRPMAFKPFLISMPNNGAPPAFSFSGTSVAGSANHARLLFYDHAGGRDNSQGVDTGNIIQLIPLAFPAIPASANLRLPQNRKGAIAWFSTSQTAGSFPTSNSVTNNSRYRIVRETGNMSDLIYPEDIVQSLVPNHGDFRLLAAKRNVMQGQGRTMEGEDNLDAREFPTFVAHPNYGRAQQAHSLMETMPEQNELFRRPTASYRGYTSPLIQNDYGYFTRGSSNSVGGVQEPLNYTRAYLPDFPIKPWEDARNISVRLVAYLSTADLRLGALTGGRDIDMPMPDVFNATRYDLLNQLGPSARFKRGYARPDVTGDFDTGVGPSADGPYINRGDDGDVRGARGNGWPYFQNLESATSGTSAPLINAAMFSPNRVMPSAGMFGSLPTGVQANVPWMTLLFRPDPERTRTTRNPDRYHFGSRFPRDHLFMDLFWMPVVQPYAISEPFETKGKINMNHQILPFTYIKRATALHALLKGEKIMAIPNQEAGSYKIADRQGGANGAYAMPTGSSVRSFRHFIDPAETLRQWDERFADRDESSMDRRVKPGAYLSPTEICDLWLVPYGQRLETMPQFWDDHRVTGDNVKERPYTNLYPRLTTRSNAYRVHVVAQALKKNRRSDPGTFDQAKGDMVMSEYRGSYLVERAIDPTDPDIPDYATIIANASTNFEPLDRFYYYRISQVKQFVR